MDQTFDMLIPMQSVKIHKSRVRVALKRLGVIPKQRSVSRRVKMLGCVRKGYKLKYRVTGEKLQDFQARAVRIRPDKYPKMRRRAKILRKAPVFNVTFRYSPSQMAFFDNWTGYISDREEDTGGKEFDFIHAAPPMLQ